MSFKNISDYSSKDLEFSYTTKNILDKIFDKSINRDTLLSIRRSLIFDDGLDLNKLVKDHQWYIDSLKQPKVAKTPKATKSSKTVLRPRTKAVAKSPAKSTKSSVKVYEGRQGLAKYRDILKVISNKAYSGIYGDKRTIASQLYRSGGDPHSINDVKEAMMITAKGRKRVERAPRTLSQGLQNYHKVLRTVREIYPYKYQDAQKLASKIYKSGIDPNSEIEIMKAESRIAKSQYRYAY